MFPKWLFHNHPGRFPTNMLTNNKTFELYYGCAPHFLLCKEVCTCIVPHSVYRWLKAAGLITHSTFASFALSFGFMARRVGVKRCLGNSARRRPQLPSNSYCCSRMSITAIIFCNAVCLSSLFRLFTGHWTQKCDSTFMEKHLWEKLALRSWPLAFFLINAAMCITIIVIFFLSID